MAWLMPCPGCGRNCGADEGHHLCRECEGYPARTDAATLTAADRIELLEAERDQMGADLLTVWRVRNAALAMAASHLHPGPDHADYTIRRKMITEWVADGHEQVDAENAERTQMLQRLIAAEAEVERLRDALSLTDNKISGWRRTAEHLGHEQMAAQMSTARRDIHAVLGWTEGTTDD